MRLRVWGVAMLALAAMGLLNPAFGDVIVYKTNFNALTAGTTLSDPGRSGQDGWFSSLAPSPSYGEIQEDIANTGSALHERSDRQNAGNDFTVDTRRITPPDLSTAFRVKLSFDFYAHSDNYANTNSYTALMKVTGGPDPGFQVLSMGLAGGNGQTRNETGVGVLLYYFNGTNNNDYIPLTVGQALSWDAWHSVTLVIDQMQDRYVSLTVDGSSQDLSAYRLLYNEIGPDNWARGQLMEQINTFVVAQRNIEPNVATNDDIYWDNLSLTAVPEPATMTLLALGGLAAIGRRLRRKA